MKPSASKNTSALQRKVSPIVAIIVAVVVVALIGGIYAYISAKNQKQLGAKYLKGIDTMMDLSKKAHARWQNEVELAKKEGRAPNESFRPGPNMAPIDGQEPLRMGGGASLSRKPPANTKPIGQ